MKLYALILALAIVLSGFTSVVVSAKMEDTDDVNVKEEKAKDKDGKIIKDKYGNVLIKRTVSHPKESSARKTGNARTKDTCTKYFATWGSSTPVTYRFNPINTQGLNWEMLIEAMSLSTEAWDSAVSRELVYEGIGAAGNYGVYDGINSVVFGEYVSDPNVIAQTIIWYYKIGSIGRIVEFDITLEDNQPFGFGEINKFDVQGIATHEYGHAFGMSDLYTSTCSQQTMYGYSWFGDVEKRTLENGDIKGIRILYP
jgi:hypothetical protein